MRERFEPLTILLDVLRQERTQSGMSARRYGPPVGGGALALLFAAGSSISQSMLLTVPVTSHAVARV